MVLRQTPQNENISYSGCGKRGPPAGFLGGFSRPTVVIFRGIPPGRLPRGMPVVTATTSGCDRNPATLGPTSGVEVSNAADLLECGHTAAVVINRRRRCHSGRYQTSPPSDVHDALEVM